MAVKTVAVSAQLTGKRLTVKEAAAPTSVKGLIVLISCIPRGRQPILPKRYVRCAQTPYTKFVNMMLMVMLLKTQITIRRTKEPQHLIIIIG